MAAGMESLARHYRRMRSRYPDDRLVIICDIDGTIVDRRRTLMNLLLAYDRSHKSSHFEGLRIEDVPARASRFEDVLRGIDLPAEVHDPLIRWLRERAWSSELMREAQRPYPGALDLLRWFQLQEQTQVGLNSGRPELLRADTLALLNELGLEYRLRFEDSDLFMNGSDWYSAGDTWLEEVRASKREGLRYFSRDGARVIAVIDSDNENLQAMAKDVAEQEVLLIRSEDLFLANWASQQDFDLGRFAAASTVIQGPQLVWHSINDRSSLNSFLLSDVQWAECDLRRDPLERLVLRDYGFEVQPWSQDEDFLFLSEVLEKLAAAGRGLKIDMVDLGPRPDDLIEALRNANWPDNKLWFNGVVEDLGEEGFLRLADAFPRSVRQCPVDFMSSIAIAAPTHAQRLLKFFESWGVTRFSVRWDRRNARRMARFLRESSCEINIYDVPDLESYLQAALLLPRSLTTRFRMPARTSLAASELNPV